MRALSGFLKLCVVQYGFARRTLQGLCVGFSAVFQWLGVAGCFGGCWMHVDLEFSAGLVSANLLRLWVKGLRLRLRCSSHEVTGFWSPV